MSKHLEPSEAELSAIEAAEAEGCPDGWAPETAGIAEEAGRRG